MSRSEEKSKKNGRLSMLFVMATVSAGLLLAVIIAVGAVLISGIAIVTDDSGKTTVVFGGGGKSDPFKRPASTLPPEMETSTGLVIEDPPSPSVSINPTENPGELTVSEIAKTVGPSVVGITVIKNGQGLVASGVILSTNGYIVTTADSVIGASKISVMLDNGETYPAELVGADRLSDIAVICIDADGLDAATFGNSDAAEVGDLAVAIGTPYSLGLMGTTTSGIISAINRDIIIEGRVMSLLRTDAYIANGCAGGAIVNRFGQVIGIISESLNGVFDGIGFAVPMNTAKPIIEDIIEGRLERSLSLGLTGRFIDQKLADNLSVPQGLYVYAVWTGSDAFEKGIRTGDVVVAMDGVEITDLAVYDYLRSQHKAGESALIRVYRDEAPYDSSPGEYFELEVRLGYIN